MTAVNHITAQQLQEHLSGQERFRLIDVRDYDEYQRQHVVGADCVPLAQLLRRAGEWSVDEPVILICRSGIRAQQAADELLALGFERLHVVEGGTQQCVREHLPVVEGRRTLPLQRQILIAAGSVILTGLIGSLFYAPAVWLSVFAASMLILAGITGFCPMARLLAKAPWNRQRIPSQEQASCLVRS